MTEFCREKRIRRPPGIFKPLVEKPAKKRKPRPTGCQYEIIPLPSKYLETEALLLYGNIPLVKINNDVFTDFSILNEFHIYNGIQVTHYSEGQRILSIKADRRTDTRFPRWKTFAKKWSRAKDPKHREYGKAVRKYSLLYEKHMNNYFNQNLEAEIKGTESPSSKFNNKQPKTIKVDLLSRYPCIQLKTSFKGFENRLVDIIVNEKFLDTLGYTVDSFVSTTLKEGLPQLFSLQSESNSCFAQKILECYSLAMTPNCKTPGLEVTLLTRSGFVKPATVEIHFSMNPLHANYDSETIFVVTSQGEPYLPSQAEQPLQLNPDFLDIMYTREQTMCVLLYDCYGYNFMPEYTNLNKVCTIKELQKKEDSFCKLEPYDSL